MAKDLLLEIGLEEVPARFVQGALQQLKERTETWLRETRIDHTEVFSYATPRRLAVMVKNVAEKQHDVREENKGPAKKIAVDESGAWTKAALGFARGQGVEPEDLYFKKLGDVEYVYAMRSSEGSNTQELLSEGLTHIITNMTFPKNMRWGSHELRFVRPIKWITALYGPDVVELEIAGVRSGRVTYGHRFLGSAIELHDPDEYIAKLREQYVIADIEERKAEIRTQINRVADANNWQVPIQEDLLEEVLFLLEYPTVLTGSFDQDFLHIPQEVLVTSMREHQRYFPVMDATGKLLPYFITVRNGDDTSLDQVARGNEKVLRARLADAKFFYEEDQKLSIDAALSKLEQVVFHEELGTIGDKIRRIKKTAEQLAKLCNIPTEEQVVIQRAAAICKFDLVTLMVDEFPELQGVMGMDYAHKAGESDAVAQAIYEHYRPRHSGDGSPESLAGAIVSIADKIDTIVGCFAIGIIPTGSQDPYALRRQAAAIVQILLDHKLPILLDELFDLAIQVYNETQPQMIKQADDVKRELGEFFALRVKHVLSLDARYDVVDAVMASGFADVAATVRRCEALMDAVQQPAMKEVCESFTRVANLAAKAEPGHELSEKLFQEEEEHALYKAWQNLHAAYESHLHNSQEKEALAQLAKLKDPVTAYFDSVMVMHEDQLVRNNRLTQLLLIDRDLRRFADFNKLVW